MSRRQFVGRLRISHFQRTELLGLNPCRYPRRCGCSDAYEVDRDRRERLADSSERACAHGDVQGNLPLPGRMSMLTGATAIPVALVGDALREERCPARRERATAKVPHPIRDLIGPRC